MYARTRNALLLLLGRRRRRFEKKKNNFFQLKTTTTDEKALFLTTTSRENERFAICDLLPPPTSRRNTCASLAEETRTRTTVSAMKEDKGRETERNDGVFPTKRPTLPPPPGFDEVVVEGQGKVLQRENEVFYNRPQVVNRDLSLAMIREFQKRRKEEYENETYQKTRRGKGMYNKVPKESKIIEYLVSEEERERMFASKKEVPKKSENDAKKDDGTKQKEWIEVKPGTFRWQVAGEEVKETIPKPTKVEEKKKEEEEI